MSDSRLAAQQTQREELRPDGRAEQRVGLYGGAFDPPHLTHSAMAEAFVAQAQLDALHICPTAGAWHKARALSDAVHRVAMARLAFADLPQVRIDTQEIERGGASYTLDTLEHLRHQYPQARLFLLIGQDQFEALPTWHGVTEIKQIATIYVAPRIVQSGTCVATDALANLPSAFRRLNWQANPVSATQVRERCAAGQSLAGLVTPAIARYIDEHHLYQSHP
jgi:nicotinate-nucleotide adenylyltransferase